MLSAVTPKNSAEGDGEQGLVSAPLDEPDADGGTEEDAAEGADPAAQPTSDPPVDDGLQAEEAPDAVEEPAESAPAVSSEPDEGSIQVPLNADGVGSVRVPVNCMEILDVRGDGMRTCTWNSVPRHPELTRVTLAGEPFATISITVLTR